MNAIFAMLLASAASMMTLPPPDSLPHGEWLRITAVGLINKPYPVIWLLLPKSHVPSEWPNEQVTLDRNSFGLVSTYSQKQSCSPLKFSDAAPALEIRRRYKDDKIARCTLLHDDGCRYLSGLKPLLPLPAATKAINALRSRMSCQIGQ
jgi:hypothetical protein